jgi:GAF domain-containing protein
VHPSEAAILPSAVDLPLATELSAVFARAHGLLLTEETVQHLLGLVTALAHDTLGPSTVGAGVSVLDTAGRRTSSAATGELVAAADSLQYELGEGPCMAAWAGRTMVRLDDTASDERWPRWAAAAAGLGLRSALSAPLVAGDRAFGAIKVYADEPNAYDERSQRLLSMFAGQAAVLLAGVRTVQDARRMTDELRQGMRQRDLVAMAKGVLMASEQVGEDAAFALLVGLAQREHRSLHEVAASVVASSARGPAVVRSRAAERR